ncbi:hypothetical protein FKW77_009616 [Venturia effusa]|uniref:cysteine--tRNA ligase n=1 Tax=Venturia effusa TaxID=50376 RepID=A0A517L051_9PEZI|nr:hypothetical protein FKW77_009616 [Venturia effusa]
MASTARSQPPWSAPKSAPGVRLPPLQIYNSLTRQKNSFVPQDATGKAVTWYACGPTVYDDSHLGHARNYMSTDVLRRILTYYFDFKINFVMNITDVDDKIILRGRQQHLLAKYKKENLSMSDSVRSNTKKAFEAYVTKNLPLIDGINPEDFEVSSQAAYNRVLEGKALEGDDKPSDKEAKIKMHLKTANSAASALIDHSMSLEDFYSKAEDVLLPYFDNLYGAEIDASDHTVFTVLTQKYEKRFFEDMDSLNNLRPDKIVRVTEFGNEIVAYVEQIVKNGFAYASDGSVYFDIDAFKKAGYPYARLKPESVGDAELVADGEGALSKGSAKKSSGDFALWKSSKPGEPAWPSPWGPGRPGWHIECSVMASAVLGKTMDIHSGGVDLCFPHHDNEMAQAEAFFANGKQWVNYFVHFGHLSISGSKMSKSLKNFTTVREALSRKEWTPRSLRMVFLLGSWKDGCEITDRLVKHGAGLEDKITNWFLKTKEFERNSLATSEKGPSEKENDAILLEKFQKAERDLDGALCDSFDTSKALQIISELITDFNSVPSSTLSNEPVLVVARWVTRILTIFGLDGNEDPADVTRIGWAGVDIPKPAHEFIFPLSALRDEVRAQARSKELSYTAILDKATEYSPAKIQDQDKIKFAEVYSEFQEEVKTLAEKKAPAKDLLALADRLRDLSLWDLDIYLEDRDGLPALVRPVDNNLRSQRAEKDNLAQAKLVAKAKREKDEAEKKKAAEEKAKIHPKDLFRTEEYSEWTEEGLPTKVKDGKEVTKNQLKKLTKEWEKQKKVHEEWIKGQRNNSLYRTPKALTDGNQLSQCSSSRNLLFSNTSSRPIQPSLPPLKSIGRAYISLWPWSSKKEGLGFTPPPATREGTADSFSVSTKIEVAADSQDVATATSSPPQPPEATSIVDTTTDSTPLLLDSADESVMATLQSPIISEDHYGFLREMGLNYGFPYIRNTLEVIMENVHVHAGTEWWATIALSAIAVRLVMMVPMAIGSHHIAKLEIIKPYTEEAKEKMEKARLSNDPMAIQEARKEAAQLMKAAGYQMGWPLAPMFLQGLFGFAAFRLLRAMTELPVPGLETGGALWFMDLTVPDPWFALPLAMGFVMHLIGRIGGEMGRTEMSESLRKTMLYIIPPIISAVVAFQPAALQVSFLTAIIWGAGQAYLFRRPWFRKFFRMEPFPTRPSQSTPSDKAQELASPAGHQSKIAASASAKSGKTLRIVSPVPLRYEAPRARARREMAAFHPPEVTEPKAPKKPKGLFHSLRRTMEEFLESGRKKLGMSTPPTDKEQRLAEYERRRRMEKKYEAETRRQGKQ